MSEKDKIWYSSKEELFDAVGGPREYVFLSCPMEVEYHFHDGVKVETVDPMMMPLEEKEGCTYFFTIDTWVPDDECADGIYIAIDDYQKRIAEVDPD